MVSLNSNDPEIPKNERRKKEKGKRKMGDGVRRKEKMSAENWKELGRKWKSEKMEKCW